MMFLILLLLAAMDAPKADQSTQPAISATAFEEDGRAKLECLDVPAHRCTPSRA
jgi:hypothetical protein